jgi:hypothetical protein
VLFRGKQLNRIEAKIDQLLKGAAIMATDLSAIQTAVSNETTVEQSAILLLQKLAAEIKASAADPAAVKALADQINANATALAAAVTANTPAA